MVVAEQYPNLKANQGFQDLRVQLEGTENRITVARNRYIQTVADYNVLARSFPTNLTAMVFGYKVKPNFTVQNEAQISAPPTVNFDKPASATRRRRCVSRDLAALHRAGDAPAGVAAAVRCSPAAAGLALRRRTCCRCRRSPAA